MPQTVLITGASTGFGKLTAQRFFAQGWNVVATMRNTAAGEELAKLSGNRVLVTTLDVQKQDTIDAAVAATIEKFGKIDVLINNAGYGSLGFFEGSSEEEIKRQFDINNLGVFRVTKAVVPHMRKECNGQIVNISSVAGYLSSISGTLYNSSKWGLEGWSENLSYELLPFNIQVKLVQPGGYKTEFVSSKNLTFNPPPADVPEYTALAEGIQAMMGNLIPNLPDPAPVIDTIFKASTERNVNEMRYPIFEEADGYGKLYQLRESSGYEAQLGAVMTTFNNNQAPEAQPDLEGPQTVVITGCSTGFGKLAAEDLAAKGWNVVATMRNTAAGEELAKLPNVLVLELDVQKQDTIDKAVAATIEKFGKIDVLINNAGYGSWGFLEGTSEEEIKRQYDINVFGVFRVTKAVLPHMRKEKKGQIVNISSVVASVTTATGSTYGSSKWILDGWAESLQIELAPFNIQVKLVQPGGFKTGFGNNMTMTPPPEGVPEYAEMAAKIAEFFGKVMPTLPEGKPLVTDAIYKASINRNPTEMRFPVWGETEPFGPLYLLRKAKGGQAQIDAVLAASGQ